jgi:hypothetical protein
LPFLEHEAAKSELKATGHGLLAKRSKSGAISFDVLEQAEASHAAV